MKVIVAEKEPVVSLKFRQDNEENEVVVEDTEKEWNLVGFKVVNGKISLVIYGGIDDENYNLTEEGTIEIVDE